MNTYRFYEQGGTHVLGTFDNDTLLGERTFNTKRLEAVEYQGKIDVKDKVTEKYILKEQVYTNILKEDGTTWGDNVTNSVTALNIFLNSIPYNIADLQDIPYPKVNNGYLKFQDGEYDWGALSIPSPPPENTDFLDEGVTNLYFTEDRARDSVSATGSLNYDSETGVFSYTQGDTDTVSEGITNLYYTNDRVDERINLAIGDLTAFLNRYNAEAAANKLLASTDTVIVEKYLTVQADGHGESISAQSNTPSSGNVIQRKIWYKANSFEQSAVNTWTPLYAFPDDTAYADTTAIFEAFLNGQSYGTPPFTLAQTWEDTQAFVGVLDIAPNASAAYSLRKLRFAYTGDAVNVRRASDNAVQDIGFTAAGDLDVVSLAAFCSGTDGYVVRWYDQSGNGNDAVQASTTLQPQIVASGSVLTENGKPAFRSTDATTLNLTTRIANVGSVFSVFAPTDVITSNTCFILGDTIVQSYYHSGNGGLWLSGNFANSTVVNGSNYLNGASVNLTTTTRTAQQFVMSMIHVSNNSIVGTISQDRANVRSWIGTRQEVILYASDQSANRAGIESNINAYYSIY